MQYLKHLAHRFFRVTGYDFLRYSPDNFVSLKRAAVLAVQDIDLVLDIGASEGTYPLALREAGYRGRIISFEPLSQPFSVLQRRAARDRLWGCVNLAIGERDDVVEMYVSGHQTSSSLLPMTGTHLEAMPASATTCKEVVKMARLDSLSEPLLDTSARIYLKADVQGYEKQVLLGAVETLRRVCVLELELSLMPLYEGAALMNEMISFLSDLGYAMVSAEPVFCDPHTGVLLQVDGIFVRTVAPLTAKTAGRSRSPGGTNT